MAVPASNHWTANDRYAIGAHAPRPHDLALVPSTALRIGTASLLNKHEAVPVFASVEDRAGFSAAAFPS